MCKFLMMLVMATSGVLSLDATPRTPINPIGEAFADHDLVLM